MDDRYSLINVPNGPRTSMVAKFDLDFFKLLIDIKARENNIFTDQNSISFCQIIDESKTSKRHLRITNSIKKKLRDSKLDQFSENEIIFIVNKSKSLETLIDLLRAGYISNPNLMITFLSHLYDYVNTDRMYAFLAFLSIDQIDPVSFEVLHDQIGYSANFEEIVEDALLRHGLELALVWLYDTEVLSQLETKQDIETLLNVPILSAGSDEKQGGVVMPVDRTELALMAGQPRVFLQAHSLFVSSLGAGQKSGLSTSNLVYFFNHVPEDEWKLFLEAIDILVEVSLSGALNLVELMVEDDLDIDVGFYLSHISSLIEEKVKNFMNKSGDLLLDSEFLVGISIYEHGRSRMASDDTLRDFVWSMYVVDIPAIIDKARSSGMNVFQQVTLFGIQGLSEKDVFDYATQRVLNSSGEIWQSDVTLFSEAIANGKNVLEQLEKEQLREWLFEDQNSEWVLAMLVALRQEIENPKCGVNISPIEITDRDHPVLNSIENTFLSTLGFIRLKGEAADAAAVKLLEAFDSPNESWSMVIQSNGEKDPDFLAKIRESTLNRYLDHIKNGNIEPTELVLGVARQIDPNFSFDSLQV